MKDTISLRSMVEPVIIPISTFDIAISYARPVLNLWLDRAVVVQSMFDAFEQWSLTADDVEAVTTGKPSEQGVKFKLPKERITFFFGPSLCRFTKEGATWEGADETVQILESALGVLVKTGTVHLAKRATSLALHLQPKNLPFLELLRPFLSPSLSALENTPSEAMAYVVRWKGRRVTLDGSAAIANGVFLHLERDFGADSTFDEIKTTLRNDEAELFQILNVEEVES